MNWHFKLGFQEVEYIIGSGTKEREEQIERSMEHHHFVSCMLIIGSVN